MVVAVAVVVVVETVTTMRAGTKGTEPVEHESPKTALLQLM